METQSASEVTGKRDENLESEEAYRSARVLECVCCRARENWASSVQPVQSSSSVPPALAAAAARPPSASAAVNKF